MKCTKEDGTSRYCPYRVFQETHQPVLKGAGSVITQEFYNCMRTLCAAYDENSDECMRLNIERKE
ncbi:MAG: hypothetical protein ACI4E1_07715 [Lachnospira sp.]